MYVYIHAYIQTCIHIYVYIRDLHKYLYECILGSCGTLPIHISNIIYDVLQTTYQRYNVSHLLRFAVIVIFTEAIVSWNPELYSLWKVRVLSKIYLAEGLYSVWGMVPHSSQQIDTVGENHVSLWPACFLALYGVCCWTRCTSSRCSNNLLPKLQGRRDFSCSKGSKRPLRTEVFFCFVFQNICPCEILFLSRKGYVLLLQSSI